MALHSVAKYGKKIECCVVDVSVYAVRATHRWEIVEYFIFAAVPCTFVRSFVPHPQSAHVRRSLATSSYSVSIGVVVESVRVFACAHVCVSVYVCVCGCMRHTVTEIISYLFFPPHELFPFAEHCVRTWDCRCAKASWSLLYRARCVKAHRRRRRRRRRQTRLELEKENRVCLMCTHRRFVSHS